MKNKTFRSLFLITSMITAVASASSQTTITKTGSLPRPYYPNAGGAPQQLSGLIRIPKEFGVVPSGPYSSIATPFPCMPFFVAVMDPGNKNKIITYTQTALESGRDDGVFYTCKYSVTFPRDKQVYVVAGMGSPDQFNYLKRWAMYWSDPWIGGTNNKPRRGYERSFAGKYITLGVKPMYLRFDLSYVQVDPN